MGKVRGFGRHDDFSLTLTISDLFTNETDFDRKIYLKIYEGDDKRWPIIYDIQIVLPACQGITPPTEVLDAEPDAYWIWNATTSTCEWSGEYTDSDGDGIPDKAPESDEVAAEDDNLMLYLGGGIGIAVLVLLSLFFVLRAERKETSSILQWAMTSAQPQLDTLVLLRWIQWSNTSNN